jgi:Tol biopolymer transport system component
MVLVGVSCLLVVILPAASVAEVGSDAFEPPGTIAVATPADFRTILLVSPASGDVARVRAPDKILGLQVDLSRDGSRIAFAGTRGLWAMSRGGTGARRVLRVSGGARFVPDWVVWSPSGRELAYTRREALFRVPTTGEPIVRLLHGRAYAPDWAPTGRSIYFVRGPALRSGAGLIQSIGVDGHNLRSIVRGGHPDVSPDGSKLAFARRDGIYVLSVSGGEPRRVVARGEHPEWSPDGRYLAFTREVDCGHAGCEGRIFVVRSTGGRAHAIGPRIFDIGPLSWSR